MNCPLCSLCPTASYGAYPICKGCSMCSRDNGCVNCQPKLFLFLRRERMRQYGECLHDCPAGYYGMRSPELNMCSRKSTLTPHNTPPSLSHCQGFHLQADVFPNLMIYRQLSRGDTHTSWFGRLICLCRWMEVVEPHLNSVSTGIWQQAPASVNAVSCFCSTLHLHLHFQLLYSHRECMKFLSKSKQGALICPRDIYSVEKL